MPITSKQLIAAVSVSPDGKPMKVSIDDITDVSRTLVVLDKELDQFELAHLSVREFLETKEQFSCVVQNVVVGQRCLVACMDNGDTHPDVVSANEELRSYAKCCWGLHCSFSEEGRIDENLDLGPERNYLPKLFKQFTVLEGAGSPEFRRSISDFDQEAESLLKTMPSTAIESGKLRFFFERMRACAWGPGQETPNFAACVWSFKEILVIKARTQKSDLHMLNINGHTCLHIAAAYSIPEIVQLLLRRGADPNYGNGILAIHLVAERGSLSILNLLLKAKADFEAKDDKGRSPLMVAVANNHLTLVERLLEQGAKIDVIDHGGTTPFHIAVAKGFHEITDLLMNHGRLHNTLDSTGYNILHLSILFRQRAILTRLLSKEEIDINSSSSFQLTPLGMAALIGRSDIVTLLVKRKDLDIKKHSREWTPLLWATLLEHDDVTTALHARQPLDYAELAMQFHVDRTGRYHHGPFAQFYAVQGSLEARILSVPDVDDDQSADKSRFVWQAILGSMIPIDRMIEAMKEATKDRKALRAFYRALYSSDFHIASKAVCSSVEKPILVENALHQLLADRPVVDPNEMDQYGRTPLWWAVSTGNIQLAAKLLKSGGVNPNMEDDIWGLPPLSIAIIAGREKLVDLLIARADVNVNAQDDEWGQTPLIHACRHGRQICAQHLLARSDIAIDICDRRWWRNALSWASGEGHLALVQILLQRSPDCLNITDKDGNTPLLHSIFAGHGEIASILLQHPKTDAALRNKSGQTALWTAAYRGLSVVFAQLLDLAENKTPTTDYKGRSLVQAAMLGGHIESALAMMMREQAALFGIMSIDRNGMTALMIAASHGYESIVQSLLDKHPSLLYATDSDGLSALSHAARNGHLVILKVLMRAMSSGTRFALDSTQTRDKQGRTPFSWAAEYGHIGVVFHLRQVEPALTSLFDNHGRCALSWAASGGQETVVRFLLGCLEIRRMLRDLQDCSGRTPWEWALENDHGQIATYIQHALREEAVGARMIVKTRITTIPDRFISRRCLSMPPYKITESGQTRIFEAMQYRELQTLQKDLLYSTDPNERDEAGKHPIEYAIADNNKAASMRFIGSRRMDEESLRILQHQRPEWILEHHLLSKCFSTMYPYAYATWPQRISHFRISQSKKRKEVEWTEKQRQGLKHCCNTGSMGVVWQRLIRH